MLLHQPRLIPSWEWEVSTVSCLQQPCSATVVSCPWFLLWSQSSHFSLVSCCLLYFPELLSFPKNPAFSWCAPKRTASVLSFLPSVMIHAWFALVPTHYIFLAVQSLCPVLPQHWMNSVYLFIFSTSLLHCPAFASIHSNREHKGEDTLSLGLYWHIFPLGDLS